MSAVTLPVSHRRPVALAILVNSTDSCFVRFSGRGGDETLVIHCEVLKPQVTGYPGEARLPRDSPAPAAGPPGGQRWRRYVVITTPTVSSRYCGEVTRAPPPEPANPGHSTADATRPAVDPVTPRSGPRPGRECGVPGLPRAIYLRPGHSQCPGADRARRHTIGSVKHFPAVYELPRSDYSKQRGRMTAGRGGRVVTRGGSPRPFGILLRRVPVAGRPGGPGRGGGQLPCRPPPG